MEAGAVIGNFQGDYFCGSGLGFDDGQEKKDPPPGTNDGTDGGKPVICEHTDIVLIKIVGPSHRTNVQYYFYRIRKRNPL